MLKEILSLYYRLKIPELICFFLFFCLALCTPFLTTDAPRHQRFLISTLVFSSIAIGILTKKRNRILNLLHLPQALASACVLFILLVAIIAIQLLPLPIAAVERFHASSYNVYESAHLSWFPTSMEPLETLLSLWWLVTIGTVTWATARLPSLPRFKIKKKGKEPRYGRRKKASNQTPQQDEGDLTSDLFKWAIVIVSILVGIGAAFDWQAQMNASTNRNVAGGIRADWPLGNASHLALFLNVGLMQLFMIFNVEQSRHRKGSRYKGLSRQLVEFLSKPSGFLVFVIGMISLTSITRGIGLTKTRAGATALKIAFLYAGFVTLAALRVRSQFFNSFFLRHRRLRRVEKKIEPLVAWLFRYAHRIGFAFFTIVGPLLFFLFSELDSAYLPTRAEGSSSVYVNISKFSLWNASRLMIQDNPILGVGFGCWKLSMPRYASEIFAHYSFNYAHNDYIQMFSEVGLLGCSWVGCAVGYFIWNTGRTVFLSKFSALTVEFLGSYLSITMFLMFGLVDFPFHSPGISILFAILLADYFRIHHRLQRENGNVEESGVKTLPRKQTDKSLFFKSDNNSFSID